jgi:hypothetical protein
MIVATSTPKPRILRNGLTPRISSSVAHTRIAATERRCSVVRGLPLAILNRCTIDKAMKTDNAGHWTTVMPPVRRLTNVHRTIRRNFEESLPRATASSGLMTVTPPMVGHDRTGAVPPAWVATVSVTVCARRTGLDSIPESTLESNGWLDFKHQQEKTFGRRGQLLELGRAAWAGGQMVQQCRLFSSVEYPSGQLSEVCFESLVGGSLCVDHREITAKSAVRDGCFLVS